MASAVFLLVHQPSTAASVSHIDRPLHLLELDSAESLFRFLRNVGSLRSLEDWISLWQGFKQARIFREIGGFRLTMDQVLAAVQDAFQRSHLEGTGVSYGRILLDNLLHLISSQNSHHSVYESDSHPALQPVPQSLVIKSQRSLYPCDPASITMPMMSDLPSTRSTTQPSNLHPSSNV